MLSESETSFSSSSGSGSTIGAVMVLAGTPPNGSGPRAVDSGSDGTLVVTTVSASAGRNVGACTTGIAESSRSANAALAAAATEITTRIRRMAVHTHEAPI